MERGKTAAVTTAHREAHQLDDPLKKSTFGPPPSLVLLCSAGRRPSPVFPPLALRSAYLPNNCATDCGCIIERCEAVCKLNSRNRAQFYVINGCKSIRYSGSAKLRRTHPEFHIFHGMKCHRWAGEEKIRGWRMPLN